MGVPAFFRWLSRKYCSIVIECNEEKPKVINGVKIPVDTSKPNPNDIEFDNLYLDMNGIIHPCSHPEDRPAPKNETEIMIAIFEAIDRIFGIVRPRRLLYLAIDGVAPRAKMNQQRSRRFRASKEGWEQTELKQKIKDELRARGCRLPPDDPKAERFDSNCITPGTEFMHRLANALRYYITERLNSDPGWANIEVILSDANVPGEGEHKIMDFIRRQRGQSDHDPNTHHCICGADADLIMLGLATHEPNFTIIREEFKPNAPRPCTICGQIGHEMADCEGLPREESEDGVDKYSAETSYIFIRISTIREYIEYEMKMPNLPFKYDFENVIDDWVMMCFFVGNDFLPHLPSLEIREGAIDKLVNLYKDIVHSTGGYLTKNGKVNLGRVEKIMRGIGKMEDEIFKRRRENDLKFRERERAKRRRSQNDRDRPAYTPGGQFAPIPLGGEYKGPKQMTNIRQTARDMRLQDDKNKEAAASLVAMLRKKSSSSAPDSSAGAASSPAKNTSAADNRTSPATHSKRKRDEDDDEPADDVRLWEDGWKERYFRNKFDVSMKDYNFRRTVVKSYVQGLCWVLSYYYQGCASWKWFFPFHYAPFASDFVDLEEIDTSFPTTTVPKRPLEQLMCVFPAASGQFLPTQWRALMSDPDSDIIDFYPEDFKIDLNGKKYAWQGVALLPFVDEERMMNTLQKVYPTLNENERERNSKGDDYIFVGPRHPLHALFAGLYEGNNPPPSLEEAADINPQLAYGMAGKVWNDQKCDPDAKTILSPVRGLHDVIGNRVLSMKFKDPAYPEKHIFEAKVLPGAKFPEKTVKPEDFEAGQRRSQGRGGYRGRGGRGGGGNWTPRIGFNPNRTQHASLSPSGHRHLNHNLPQRYPPPQQHYGNAYNQAYQPRGSYVNVPPPGQQFYRPPQQLQYPNQPYRGGRPANKGNVRRRPHYPENRYYTYQG